MSPFNYVTKRYDLNNDWEQRKLGDIANFSKGRGYTKNSLRKTGNEIILYGRLYTNFKTIISNVHTFADISNYAVFSTLGDVIVPGSGETAKDISRASVVNKDGIILGGDLNIIKINHNLLNAVFLALTISNGAQQKELIKIAQGKSIVHLHNSDLKKVKVVTPIVQEQEQIGTLFNKLDNTIALHQFKIKKIQKIKQGLLHVITPKRGQLIPFLRFANFSSSWEQRQLDSTGEIITGSTPSTLKSENYSTNGSPWVTPTDIISKTTINTAKKLSKVGESASRMVPANTILVTSIASIGKNTMLLVPGSFNQQINGIVPDNNNDSYFLLTMSELWSRTMKSFASSGIMQIVNKSEFSKMKFPFPDTKEEQMKIGYLFRQLDNTIALHQTKIEKLQQIKKAYLQKMFI